MKGKVPRRVPRIFPFVGHGDDVFVVEVVPLAVTPVLSFYGRGWSRWVTFDPSTEVAVIKLLGPEQTGKRLALYFCGIFATRLAGTAGVEFVSLGPPLRKKVVKSVPKGLRPSQGDRRGGTTYDRRLFVRKPKSNGLLGSRLNLLAVDCSRLRALARWIHSVLITVNHAVVYSVLHVGAPVVDSE